MMLMEALTELFESSKTDYRDLLLKAAKSASPSGKMTWSSAATKLAQDKQLMARVSAVAGKYAKDQDERDDIIQDWFVSQFGKVIAAAAKGINTGNYTGEQFLSLVGGSVKNHALNMKRSAKIRSGHEKQKGTSDVRGSADMSKRYGGKSGGNFGHYSDEKKLLLRVVTDVIKGAKSEKEKVFLTAYFGLDKGQINFSGQTREALKSAGLEVNNKNQVWASRQVKAALDKLRSNKALQKSIAMEAEGGDLASKMMLTMLAEDTESSYTIFEEWLRSHLTE